MVRAEWAIFEEDYWAITNALEALVQSSQSRHVLLVDRTGQLIAQVGADPAIYALTVAIATSNSFLIPTHQVNALIMGPGGYRVIDYLKAGSIMTIVFMVVALVMLNVVF